VWSDSRIKTRGIVWGKVGGDIGKRGGDLRVGAKLEKVLKAAAECAEIRARIIQDVRERVSQTYLTKREL